MESIHIRRKNGTFIENEFDQKGNKYLGIVVSGFGYTYKNPILYYSKRVLQEKNIDYWGLDYKYYEDKKFLAMTDLEKEEYFEEDNAMVIKMIDELSDSYETIFLIGKSMGSSIIRRYIKNGQNTSKCFYILITPGSEWNEMIDDLKQINNKTLIIGSLEDKNYLVEKLPEIYKNKNIHLHELRQGNHLLETKNVETDIEELKYMIKEISQFIDNEVIDHSR